MLMPPSSYADVMGYRWATMWPVSRFPVFLMGVCAGIICLRATSTDGVNLQGNSF